jgi:hypothetical protein
MAGSFWSNFGLRFNASAPSGIDELLEKGEGNFTLQEIISHDQVIQECKYMNQQLCEYLSKPHVIKQLVQYVIAPPPPAVLHPSDTLDVGGSSDNDGGITTAAAMLRRKEKAKANAAAAAGDVAGTSSTATAAPSTSESGENAGASDTEVTPSSSEAKSDAESPLNADQSSSDEDDEGHGKPSSSLPDADADADAEQRYPYQASELFSCEASTMLDALFEPEDPEAAAAAASSATDQPLRSVAEGEEETHAAPSPISSPATTAASSPATTATSSAVASNSPSASTSPAPTAANTPTGPRLPMLDLLFSFLDQEAPIDPAHASYFRKVMVVLIQRKYEPLVKYMATHGTLDKLLKHIGLYSIMEILIMIGWDDGLGGTQDVAWLVANDLTGKLIEKLNPVWETVHNQPDVLINSSRALVDVVVKCPASTHNPLITRLLATPCQQLLFQHMFSGSLLSLSNALSIVIVLVQRYANRMDLGEEIMDEVKAAALAAQAAALDAPEDAVPSTAAADTSLTSTDASSSSSVPEPFHSLLPHLARILRLLDTEPAEEAWSYGLGRAFGETRLKVVELILVLVRCKVVEVEEIFKEEQLLGKLLDAFVKYPWNNMLHGLVESIIRTILEFLQDTCLKPALFASANLAGRVIAAYEKNEEATKKGKGFRLGYMGHLLRTAEVIEMYLKQAEEDASKAVEPETPQQVRERILGSPEAVERWATFVSGPLTLEMESCKIVLPSMGADVDDDLAGGQGDYGVGQQDDVNDQLGKMSLNGQGGKFDNDGTSQYFAGGQNDEDFTFDPDDTSSSQAYDYSNTGASGPASGSASDWADFNTNFQDAESGESPAGGDDEHGGRGQPSKQPRQLVEFTLAPDEDGDHEDSHEEEDWAAFPTPPGGAAGEQSASGDASASDAFGEAGQAKQ